ncbi:hypothetical protein KIN20_032169 [Parelaphostrongylus tenuis]|uniref:Uncharacterized protein n=1 Tax=Parelaphostrongylus tenuis TaxID=148309 RepID=A0AAD5WHV5_PARTN|nr:hypothetical protein KIN20_032169 [Parelaphostrongylus tenuis]
MNRVSLKRQNWEVCQVIEHHKREQWALRHLNINSDLRATHYKTALKNETVEMSPIEQHDQQQQ